MNNGAQISLPQPLYEKLKLRAQRTGKQADELARELLERDLRTKREPVKTGKPLDRLIALKFHGPRDLSRNVDHYLYDD
jgi:plasmid stability protein